MIITSDKCMSVSQSEQKSIAACINTIAATVRGTVPYARDMGISSILPRNSSQKERLEHATELVEAVEQWEERVKVREVDVSKEGETRLVIDYE